eukprot:TRINITY_DN39211_c0_g1_i1.p1 TRINITY_DN39211_c0_g1~~TRINITY_DN39211_c0_g1_i1.p1  ORF type:complete len:187 (-),score=44.36 TRINITY_DN39211_c0_g1_i1:44-604(-)
MLIGGNPLLQLVPVGIVYLLNQYDIEQLGYLPHLRVLFAVVQLACLALLLTVRSKIVNSPEGAKIQVPATVQMGIEVKPAVEQSTREYDLSKWFEQAQQQVIGCVMLSFVHAHWGYVLPLALQTVTVPLQLREAPLVKIHIFGQPAHGSLKRPFPAPSMFGLPPMPAAPSKPEKVKKEKDKSKKGK